MKRFIKVLFYTYLVFNTTACANWPGVIAFLNSTKKAAKSLLLFPPPSDSTDKQTTGSTTPPSTTPPTPATTPPADIPATTTPSIPAVRSITALQAAGSYNSGNIIPIEISFTEQVASSGLVTITLNNGEIVNCSSVTNASTMTCTYTVGADPLQDVSSLDVSSLNLNSGSITSVGGTNILPTTPVPTATGSISASKIISIDNTKPTVSNVATSKPPGIYGIGAVIPIQIVFSEPVFVTGTPRITLETGLTDAVVNYSSGSGTNTLTFSYSVSLGESSLDLDYLSALALNLNGGTILDIAGNASNMTLATPGTTNSLANNSAIVIDTSGRTVSIASPASITEGDTGTKLITFTVTLSSSHVVPVTVNYSTSDNTALVSDNDYVAATGVATINAGATTTTFTVVMNGDTIPEASESFFVTLNGASNAVLGTSVATGTIANDDYPTISIVNPIVAEGNSGTKNFAFTVNLSTPAPFAVTVNYATANGTATIADNDYAATSGSLSFAAGVTSQTVNVVINGDTTDETDESVLVNLSGASNASILIPTGTGVILNDDTAPTVAFSGVAPTNGSEATTAVTIPVTLSAASGQTVTVGYSVNGGTATGGGTDFTLASGTLTFNAGVTSQNISLTVVNDTITELDETIVITLAGQTNSILGTSVHTYTINDNDAPTVAFSASASNGSESTTSVSIPVTLSAAYSQTVTVDYSLSAGGTATSAGVDYSFSNGSLTFSPGETSKDITFTVVNDSLNELNETVVMAISGQTNASLGGSTYTYTIIDDDPMPTVSFASVSSSSSDESSTTRTVAIDISAASGQIVKVYVTDGGGTATSGTDYTAMGSPVTVTFPANSTATQYVSITPIQDLKYESGGETVQLTLSADGSSNATVTGIVGHTFTITDDDFGIVSAVTMDADNDGYIDHYKLTFSEAVLDYTFPGYSGTNTLGSTQAVWKIDNDATGVVLSHGTLEPVLGDIADDAIIYLKLPKSGAPDTGSKPDLTALVDPLLKNKLNTKSLEIIDIATVTEVDRALPVVMSAVGSSDSANLTVTFSESVYRSSGSPACVGNGTGGDLSASAIGYTNGYTGGATGIIGMGTDLCATDISSYNAIFVANAKFAVGDGDGGFDDSVYASGLYDASGNAGNTTAKALTITGGPTIVSIQEYDTNGNGNIDQLIITFSAPMTDSTITNFDAPQFKVGGTSAVSVTTGATSNDAIIYLFTDDSTVSGTTALSVDFTYSAGKWMGSGKEVQSVYFSNTDSVIVDKAPPVITSAVANDNITLITGVDSDDTLILTFSEATNTPSINTATIASILSLSSSHTWDAIVSPAVWNSATQLTISFAANGATINAGDTITPDGATIMDAALNKSISPKAITGSFSPAPAPTVVSATSVNTTTVRVTFSKDVNATDGADKNNYIIAASPGTGNCAADTNFVGSVLAISSVATVDSKTFDLTTVPQSSTGYTVVVKKIVRDLQPITMGCPNSADFTGAEDIKVTSASCTVPSANKAKEIIYTFSKPVKLRTNPANAGEPNTGDCTGATECGYRYKILPALGSITSVKKMDGTICNGEPVETSPTKLCITHTAAQSGSAYTVIAANNLDGDGFDDTGWGAIKSAVGDSLQPAKDRQMFTGCGTPINYFTDGPISTNPFGDGAVFGYVATYFNKIYIGPNAKGNAASRINPDGSSPETMSFDFIKDTTGLTSQTSTAGSSGGQHTNSGAASYVSIGHSGCTTINATIALGCGPDNENGRGLFASGKIGGTEYLFITGGLSGGNNDYLYYTSDTDTVLNFNFLDLQETWYSVTGSQEILGNKGTESLAIVNSKVYWMNPGDASYRPYVVKINNLSAQQTRRTPSSSSDSIFLDFRYMTGFGVSSATKSNKADIIGGTVFEFGDGTTANNLIYMGNSGSNSPYISGSCDAGSVYTPAVVTPPTRNGTYSNGATLITAISMNTGDLAVGMGVTGSKIPAGAVISAINSSTSITISVPSTGAKTATQLTFSGLGCQQTGGIIRSTNNNPVGCTAADTCADWLDITPTAAEFYKYFTIVLLKTANLIQAERPIPAFASFHSKLYMIRNACTTRVMKLDCTAGGCGDDVACPAGNEVPQLWKCTPTGANNSCLAGDWSLVANNGSDKTTMGQSGNTKATVLVTNGDRLYVGFDNTSGVQIWRTKDLVTNPTAATDFEQAGTNGLGDTTNNLQLFSAVSMDDHAGYSYIYVSAGNSAGTQPIRVYREKNTGPLAFFFYEYSSKLLAYINKEDNRKYSITLGTLVLGILTFFTTRKYLNQQKRFMCIVNKFHFTNL